MTIWYVDYESGADTDASTAGGNGDTFASRKKTLNRIVAAALAPGDTVRVKASPDPTSLGVNGTWTDGPLGLALAIDSSTNATPIVITLSSGNYTALAPAVGDTVIVNAHTTNTNANGVWKISAVNDSTTVTLVNADGSNSVGNGAGGATGTIIKFSNAVVTLASALTANIAVFGNQGAKANWTASANVTNAVITTDFKEGGGSQQVVIAAGFATGLAAYYPTGTLDLSGYQQVAFWIKQTTGTLGAAASCSLKLCSDTAGATPVNTVDIPALGALNTWSPIVVDLAGALGSSIQSIALYVNTDNGAQTFLLDNIIACKASSAADSLNLTSLIGKNLGTEPWLGIQSINNTRVVLDAHTNSSPASVTIPRGYSGTSETVTAYKRDTIKTAMVATVTTTAQAVQDSGTLVSEILISGGWNRTDMSTQTGETYFDGQNGYGSGVSFSGRGFINLENISTVRYDKGLTSYPSATQNGKILSSRDNNNNTTAGIYIVSNGTYGAQNIDITATNTCCNGSSGVVADDYSATFTIANISSNGSTNVTTYGLWLNGGNCIVSVAKLTNNKNYAVSFGGAGGNNVTLGSCSGNLTGAIRSAGTNYLVNSTISDSVKAAFWYTFGNAVVWSTNEGGNSDTHYGYTDGGLISSGASTRHTASGISWKMEPTSANRSPAYPLPLKIATASCAATIPVTVSAWFRRSNTGLTAQLICKGGQLTGVSETTDVMTAAADTWEQLSITVTPTQKGVLEFYAECWGGTTYAMYVDDTAVSGGA